MPSVLSIAVVFLVAYSNALGSDLRPSTAQGRLPYSLTLERLTTSLTERYKQHINTSTLPIDSMGKVGGLNTGEGHSARVNTDSARVNTDNATLKANKGVGSVLKDSLYDVSIRKWNSVYTPNNPWCWNKAQIKAESAFNPNAVSRVGAMGLGQFMPATWAQMQRELRWNSDVSAFTPSVNIQAQAYYMKKLRDQFKRERPEYDRHSLALASYNAGLGNILKAQKRTGGSLLYQPMIEQLPYITGHHSRETTQYVNRIWMYVREYELQGQCD